MSPTVESFLQGLYCGVTGTAMVAYVVFMVVSMRVQARNHRKVMTGYDINIDLINGHLETIERARHYNDIIHCDVVGCDGIWLPEDKACPDCVVRYLGALPPPPGPLTKREKTRLARAHAQDLAARRQVMAGRDL